MPFRTDMALTPAAIKAVKDLRQLPENATAAVQKVMDTENQYTVGRIQRRYMSKRGPTTLGVVTNRLRNSVRGAKTKITGTLDISTGIGSNVRYMGPHEFGFHGFQTVKAHTRRGTHLFGVALATPITMSVRTHTRRVDIQERAPIRKGIRDRLPQYREALSDTIVREATKS